MLRRRWETDSRSARIAYATDNMVIYSPRTVVHDPAILLGKRADDRDRYRETEREKMKERGGRKRECVKICNNLIKTMLEGKMKDC